MYMRQVVLTFLLTCVCGSALSGEQAPVNLTRFVFTDGSKMDALDTVESEIDGVVTYSIVDIAGRTRSFRDRNVVSRAPVQVDFDALPKETQEGLALGRAARKRMIFSAAQHVNNAENRLQKAYNAVSTMEDENAATAESVEARLLEIDQKIAQSEALYDGAKTLMSGTVLATADPKSPNGRVNAANARPVMVQSMEKAAVAKVQLQQEKKVLSESLNKYKSKLANLQTEVTNAQAEVDAAKSQLAAAIAKRPVLYFTSPGDIGGTARE